MKLDVPDRLVLLNLLPAEGNVLTLRIVQELRLALAFSEKELLAAELVQKDGLARWNPEADVTKEVTIGSAASGLIVDALKKLEGESRLTVNHLSLYERFVEEKP